LADVTSTIRPASSRSIPSTGWRSRDREPARVELLRHRVDQEGRVGGVRLDDRADRRVGVAGERGVEGADGDRVGATRVGELERADHLAEQLLGGEGLGGVGGQAADVELREGGDEVGASGVQPIGDLLEQLPEKSVPPGSQPDRAHLIRRTRALTA
jgi:hypothetical protein